jgi:hypothetical protein
MNCDGIEDLIRLLQDAVNGREVTREQLEATTWQAEGGIAKIADEAWIDLRIWITDKDVRRHDPVWSENWRGRLKWHLDKLSISGNGGAGQTQ